MGHSQAQKAETRERLIGEAAAQIRKDGLESVSVAGLMSSAGLTHGGFYRHFGSRSALIAEALRRALSDGEAKAKASVAAAPTGLRASVRSYLSRTHRDSPQTGCAIAALVSDVGRADPAARAVMTERIEAFIGGTARQLGREDDRAAIVAVSAMVGALALSRVLTDPKRSDQVLRTVRDYLIETLGEEA
jgi:TetR/AcrR family transcriptional repressor of nem operon